MLNFILRRLGLMLLTAFCLTFIVFFLTNLEPNLEKLAKEQNNMRMTDDQVLSWLEKNGYRDPLLSRYGQWLGAVPGWTGVDEDNGKQTGRCVRRVQKEIPTYCGVIHAELTMPTVFGAEVGIASSNSLCVS